MANFSTALEALAANQVSLDVISYQLRQILDNTPDYSQYLLSHLLKAKENHIIDTGDFQHLRNIIEPYLLDEHPISENNHDGDIPDFNTVHINHELNNGHVIKQRFKLLEILGIGGMGRVFKGIDLLKQEARDKNPYVAIKLLNEDFKSHPQAFISLQRESSRQQKLAHPNIATVYDFDRVGGPGTPVFITMELLEGQTLNTFIKTKLRRIGGLPFSEAFKIIKQLASALSYAHERGIVHSDFKPGNAFICNDGTVKTLDFGIARAVKNPIDGESERTIFDPRNLGAFTPAYASMEMLMGKAPDTRDDIYALGCVAYELLTGKHPFNKLPATKVKETNLKPEPIKGLKRKQNLTIQRALACQREDRCQTVNEFLHDLEAKYIWYKDIKTIAAGLFLILGIALYFPVNNYLQQRNISSMTDDLNSGSDQLIEKNIIEIKDLDEIQQLNITNSAKEALQNYFRKKIAFLTDITLDTYDFPKAYALLDTIKEFYPDSSFYFEQQEKTQSQQKEVLSQLYKTINSDITTVDEATRLHETLNIIKTRINSEHALLSNRSVADGFHTLSKNLLLENNLAQASNVLTFGLNFFPDNNPLLDIKKQIDNQRLLETIRPDLETLAYRSDELSDYMQYQESIQTLVKLQPADPVLSELKHDFSLLIQQAMQDGSESSNRKDTTALYEDYRHLMSSLQLNKELIELQMLNLDDDKSRQQLTKTIHQENIIALNSLIENPDVENPEWQNDVNNRISILTFLNTHSTEIININDLKRQITEIFINEATSAADKKYFDRAMNYLDTAKQYSDTVFDLNDVENTIQDALAKHRNELEISAIKKEFEVLVAANKLFPALASYEKLKTISNEHDYYIDTNAPKQLSESYRWHAKRQFNDGNIQKALELADDGLEQYAFNQTLINERDQYLVENHVQSLNEIFQNDVEFESDSIQQKFGEIENINPGRYLELRQAAIDILLDRINSLKESNINQATTLAQNANAIFPGGAISQLLNNLNPQPWADSQLAETLTKDGRLSEAINLQQSISDEYRDHPDFVMFSQIISEQTNTANKIFDLFLQKKDQAGNSEQKLRAAQSQLQQARSIWTDNPKYLAADNDIKNVIRTLQNKSVSILQPEKTDFQQPNKIDNLKPTTEQIKSWQPIPNNRECQQRFASYGKRAKAVCFDLVNDTWRGPLMVVIPPGENIANHFAISKYEISINDYSKYCALSGNCLPETDENRQDLPMTNISLTEAKNYADWISKRTGKDYRIPNPEEWRHAAFAAGKQPEKDFNCRVAIGDKVIKGTDIISVKSGQSNGWGLKNYIGNVQEWVLDNGTISAKGGAYSDTFSKCDINLMRSHSGTADNITGFRVVLTNITQ